jgi:hypothetical protein
MAATTYATVTIITIECSCGVIYGLSESFVRARQKDHETFYCPRGCHRYYAARSKEEQLQLALDRAREYQAETRQQLATERRRHAATKGTLTKTIKRAAAGVCPHCTRTFTNVQRHIASKHGAETS